MCLTLMIEFDTSDAHQAIAFGLFVVMVTIPAVVLLAGVMMTLVRLVHRLKKEGQSYKEDYLLESEKKTFIKFLQRDKGYEIINITKGTKGDMGVGICLEGGTDNPSIHGDIGIFVKKVKVGSPAEGRLFPGDRLIAINDVNITSVLLRFAVNTIRQTRGSVKFYVRREHHTQRKVIEVLKDYQKNITAVFTRQQIEEIADGFSVYDHAGQGTVKITLIIPLVRSLGYNLHETHLWYYINQLGITDHQYLTLKDFIQLMHVIVTEHYCYEDDILAAYNVFNDGEGRVLTTGKLKQAFQRMPGRLFVKDEEINDILRLAKGNMRHGGAVKYQDFRRLVLPTMKLY